MMFLYTAVLKRKGALAQTNARLSSLPYMLGYFNVALWAVGRVVWFA
jgi:hypothetical protein